MNNRTMLPSCFAAKLRSVDGITETVQESFSGKPMFHRFRVSVVTDEAQRIVSDEFIEMKRNISPAHAVELVLNRR